VIAAAFAPLYLLLQSHLGDSSAGSPDPGTFGTVIISIHSFFELFWSDAGTEDW
jgi:hypothetical protein